jgi:hypothetical protein
VQLYAILLEGLPQNMLLIQKVLKIEDDEFKQFVLNYIVHIILT